MSISESARAKLVSEIELAVTNFLTQKPGIIRDAQRQHVQDPMEKAEHKYAEAVAAADEALKVRDVAQKAFENFMEAA